MGVLRPQKRRWKVVVSMRDMEDPEDREITFFANLEDHDADRLAINSIVVDAAMKGVEHVLRKHREIMVGEE